MRVFLFWFFVFIACCSAVIADSCIFQANTFITADDYLQCVNSVELNERNTIRIVKNALRSHYIFYHSKATVINQLDALYDSSNTLKHYEMHRSLEKVLNGMFDPHTQYSVPKCYGPQTFVHVYPFRFKKRINSILFGQLPEEYSHFVTNYETLHESISGHFGKTISTINSLPVNDYLLRLGDQLAMSGFRDVRYNTAFTSYFFLNGKLLDTLNIVFTDRSSVTIRQITYVKTAYQTKEKFVKDCKTGAGSDQVSMDQLAMYKIRKEMEIAQPIKRRISETILEIESCNSVLHIADGRKFCVKGTLVSDEFNTFMILHIETMHYPRFTYFVDVVKKLKAAALARNKQITRIIIDVRSNGGGSIRIGHGLVSFFDQSVPKNIQPVMDFRPASENMLVANKDENLLSFVTGKKISSTVEYYTKNYLGIDGEYSEYFYSELSGNDYSSVQLNSSDVIVVSDGLCISACGMMLAAMKKWKSAKIISVGGNSPAGISSVASTHGSRVVQYSDLRKYYNNYPSLGNADLLLSIYQMMNMEELVPTSFHSPLINPKPLEFVPVQADFHTPEYPVTATELIEAIKPFLSSCVNGHYRQDNRCSCPDLGVCGTRCVSNIFSDDLSTCTMFKCKKGYFLEGNDCSNTSSGSIPAMSQPVVYLCMVLLVLFLS